MHMSTVRVPTAPLLRTLQEEKRHPHPPRHLTLMLFSPSAFANKATSLSSRHLRIPLYFLLDFHFSYLACARNSSHFLLAQRSLSTSSPAHISRGASQPSAWPQGRASKSVDSYQIRRRSTVRGRGAPLVPTSKQKKPSS